MSPPPAMLCRVIFIVALTIPLVCCAWNATIYKDADFKSQSQDLQGDQDCVNVADDMADKASSINTHDNCVRIYEDVDCGGLSLEVKPGTASHFSLKNLHFDNMMSSIGPCLCSCTQQ
ncbi:unnamed protein product [Bemisia tabaci]|uniref:Uncharacterized protein n=1 Tax=Bemisia tabaci TaxID=7038 RepID=A0A9P0F3H2_BEMTA|nr:unnamed protein product [Bemisia tabaci]